MGSHPNLELQKEWKLFGEEKFIYEILHELEKKEDERINYKEELAKFEEIILDEIAPYNGRGYNKAPKST
jgi:hypothetical protein